ncbi:3',5'-cyclic-AMP phosphodiesterase [Ectothiorhodospira lacustris]|uniref:3',5'-cyclic-AMP phosphodiesterase n=1 Tax=Ectothiorhodospira lacustris TaxID=2899127 RepID=UPI001EE9543D|nr:3',5'-cyclic-AMP phosphodiesterase [Ectothiorhodospira lacustris]MCG5509873.1 3',5'-cyclic-AMP phosphodiesterase [Ectothiorhodospira lacustris]MCG5521126.1 3',5'-cyclic-AMP phosphodiesterase [Ectothiorhodospira lacustris]
MSLNGPFARPQRIIQITDLHLRERPGDIMNSGINTDHSLRLVLEQIRRREKAPDLMLATGDLVHDPVAGAYRRLRTLLNPLPWPIQCLAGNHDDPQVMEDVLCKDNLSCRKAVSRGEWLFVSLCSVVDGEPHGHLDEGELAFLDEVLTRHPARNALVSLHHPVVFVGSTWMDAINLRNTEAFFQVLDRHPQVRGVLFGHVHQQVDQVRNGVRLMGTPSTCVQFAPRTRNFQLDLLPPAYRRLQLHADGRIDTEVVYAFSETDTDSAPHHPTAAPLENAADRISMV